MVLVSSPQPTVTGPITLSTETPTLLPYRSQNRFSTSYTEHQTLPVLNAWRSGTPTLLATSAAGLRRSKPISGVMPGQAMCASWRIPSNVEWLAREDRITLDDLLLPEELATSPDQEPHVAANLQEFLDHAAMPYSKRAMGCAEKPRVVLALTARRCIGSCEDIGSLRTTR